MLAELRYILGRLRGRILGWGIGLALYSLLMVALYADVTKIDLNAYLSAFPKEMMAFFPGIYELGTPHGYLDTYYFNYMTVIVGILAVGLGASLLAADEERGLLDLVLAYPISRAALFWERYLGMFLAIALVLLLGELGWLLPPSSANMGLSWIEFLMPCLPLLAVLMLFGSLTLLLSLVLPSSRMAGMVAGALLVANYLLVGLANINADLKRIVEFTPLHYYQGGYAILGLKWEWVIGLFAVALAFALIAWGLFERRDIRVGGEHEWQWGTLWQRFHKRVAP